MNMLSVQVAMDHNIERANIISADYPEYNVWSNRE